MRILLYDYEVDESFIAIDDLQGGESVLTLIDQVLADIEAETGPLMGKHILWRGDDRIWDLLLPMRQEKGAYMTVFPLGGVTLSAAKAQFKHLATLGLIPGIIP